MLSTKKKEKLIKKIQVHDKDTGSSAVQIAMLSEQNKAAFTAYKDTAKQRFDVKLAAKK